MKKKILIVDDEEMVCHLVKQILERTGDFQVITAFRGQQGLEMAFSHNPDLILLDIMMPGMGGNDVAQHLLSDPRTADIPIIFLSALAQKEEVSASQGSIGGRSFIAKPVTAQELITRVREISGKSDLV